MSDTKLLDLLPPVWRSNTTLYGLAQAVGPTFDRWRDVIGNVGRYFDPEGAPSDTLDWLMQVVALPYQANLSDRRKRNLIKAAFATWAQKGLAASITYFVQAYVGTTATVENVNTSAFIAGVTDCGQNGICGPGANAWLYNVHRIPTLSGDDAALRALLVPVAPAFCPYAICSTLYVQGLGWICSTYQVPA